MKKDYIGYIAYLFLICSVLFVWRTEHKDIHCPNLWNSTEEECKNGGGMSFSWTKPLDTDTCKQLLEKIYKAAGSEQASVKWRKALLLSVAVMCTMWLLVGYTKTEYGLPDWRSLYLSIGVGYIIILGFYLYYSFHFSKTSEDWLKDALKMMEEKGCINLTK